MKTPDDERTVSVTLLYYYIKRLGVFLFWIDGKLKHRRAISVCYIDSSVLLENTPP